MDYFGINSPEDLPKIKEVLMDETVEATKVEGLQDNKEILSASAPSLNGEDHPA